MNSSDVSSQSKNWDTTLIMLEALLLIVVRYSLQKMGRYKILVFLQTTFLVILTHLMEKLLWHLPHQHLVES